MSIPEMPQADELFPPARETARVVPFEGRRPATVKNEGDQVDADHWLESGPAFLARVREMPRPEWRVEGLILSDGIHEIHGEPRTFKTWLAGDVAIALVTGTAVAGVLNVPTVRRTAYITNEDSAFRVGERLEALLRGRGLGPQDAAGLHLSVHRGVWLDDPEWWTRLTNEITALGIDVVILDPLRSLTATVDQGPREFQPTGLALRRFQTETGATPILVHHDTKPQAGVKDERRRIHRMSGGGMSSYIDAPIHMQRLGEGGSALLTCSAWKFATDPDPLQVTLETDDPLTTARLVAVQTEISSTENLAVHQQILDYLQHSPGSVGSNVAKGIRRQKDGVLRALEELLKAGKVDAVHEKRKTSWFLNREAQS